MAFVNVHFSNCASPPSTLTQWSKGIGTASLPLIMPGMLPSLSKRSRVVVAPLTCKKASDDSGSGKLGPKKGEMDSGVVLGRKAFPPCFTFGAASAAYQIEGGASEGGRGPSIWDTFSHNHPDKIDGGSNGDVACDSYHRYKEDVKLLKDAGMDAYRFSISWSRILPKGSVKGGVNPEGVAYYNNLINELIANGIKPFVTLFHWDTPQALEDEYGGFLDRKIVDDFKGFADVCFREFGDRVQNWVTLNEPWTFTAFGYDSGSFAPGRCSRNLGCPVGDSATEPYVVGHHLILAHAEAVKLYREKYQTQQKGEVGITLNTYWVMPYSSSKHDVEAAERQMDFSYGWFLDPIVHGDYPFIMKALVKERLPKFTEEEKTTIKGSYNFIGINYYTARFATSIPVNESGSPNSYSLDSCVDLKVEKEGIPVGKPTGTWLYVYPEGIRDLMVYTHKKYNNAPIYITENGIGEVDNKELKLEEALADQNRVRFYSSHLAQVREAMKLGVNVKGYFAWSLMDNYEWNNGYTVRFGLAYVDYNDDLKRYPKASHQWFSKLLKC